MRATLIALAAFTLAGPACSGDGGQGPSGGVTLRVRVATTGVDFDTDGYQLLLGGNSARFLSDASHGYSLPPGTYDLTVTDLAPNCAVAGPNPMQVEVPSYAVAPREVTSVVVPIECRALYAEVEVTVQGSGRDFPVDGFTAQLAGPAAPVTGQVLANTPTVVNVDREGNYTVTLTSMPGHCALQDDTPRVVSVTTGGLERDRATAAFAVTCQAITGDIRVSSRTTGNPDNVFGYAVRLDGAPVIVTVPGFYYYGYYYDIPLVLRPNDTHLIERVTPGNHELSLSDIPPNCTVSGQHPRTVSVVLGAATEVFFGIVCSFP